MEGGKQWDKKKKPRKDDEDATEGPALQKALERKKKKLDREDKHNRNKVFKDEEKYHPKKPVAPFVPFLKKRVMPPVWPAVQMINQKLREFCSKHEGITFFDATPIFATNEGGGGHRLKNELISPRGHPSELGFAVWEADMMGRLQNMVTERKKKKEPVGEAADEDSGDVDRDLRLPTGDGEHMSAGKESVPPPAAQQPRQSSPSDGENNADEMLDDHDDEEEEDDDDEEDDKEEQED